jgi:uncharacterized protein (DUF433 family)
MIVENAAMTTPALKGQAAIVRTERGLTIAGTRITLYDVMDHLAAGWAPRQLLNWLPLTAAQLEAALSYIDANRTEVDAEYQAVLQDAQAMREHWDDRNRDRLTQIAQMPPKPGQEALHAKLQAWKEKLGISA